ncbi:MULTISPECIES: hypothetical protein [Halomonadaceae]|uniref:hypothetical protein n=1 Tax=Halomonadaceae TaxID=28256 RepID=UPI0015976E0D|nr:MULTISPECIES: hypothetical protein [Halomonas]QJQ93829.1 hypothetical protein HIO72_02215 [Halomonas sp. PA5]
MQRSLPGDYVANASLRRTSILNAGVCWTEAPAALTIFLLVAIGMGWRCRGLWQWFSHRKHGWGKMKRSGQWDQ